MLLVFFLITIYIYIIYMYMYYIYRPTFYSYFKESISGEYHVCIYIYIYIYTQNFCEDVKEKADFISKGSKGFNKKKRFLPFLVKDHEFCSPKQTKYMVRSANSQIH